MSYEIKHKNMLFSIDKDDVPEYIVGQLLFNFGNKFLNKIKSPNEFVFKIWEDNPHIERDGLFYLVHCYIIKNIAHKTKNKYLESVTDEVIYSILNSKKNNYSKMVTSLNVACYSQAETAISSTRIEDEIIEKFLFLNELKEHLIIELNDKLDYESLNLNNLEQILQKELIFNKFWHVSDFFVELIYMSVIPVLSIESFRDNFNKTRIIQIWEEHIKAHCNKFLNFSKNNDEIYKILKKSIYNITLPESEGEICF